jgi:hypothetical protein
MLWLFFNPIFDAAGSALYLFKFGFVVNLSQPVPNPLPPVTSQEIGKCTAECPLLGETAENSTRGEYFAF